MGSGHITRLSDVECRHLVRGHSVGRVCWLSASGLEVLPVAYAVIADQIYFRVDPTTVLGELREPVAVALEVDDIDLPTATGWSVLVRGETGIAPESQHDLVATPWAPGERPLVVMITPQQYSGRAVSADQPRS